MPIFKPKGDGFTVRWKCANNQPDTLASKAASTKAVTLVWNVFTPIDSAMVVPPFTARSARPVRESSRWVIASAAARVRVRVRVPVPLMRLKLSSTLLNVRLLAEKSARSWMLLTVALSSVALNWTFEAAPGKMIAIVGPSGAGKTTLLNAITGVAPANFGDVIFDGQSFHRMLAADKSIVGIVPQDDVVHAELTVHESLWYSARLRFPPGTARKAIKSEVGRVEAELDIERIRHSRIGDAMRRGISGGQRKRVNLGQELLTRTTRVLFLDEPTSGLDPQTAQGIVSLIRQLADGGRIVFLVTHDVTPSILSMVDRRRRMHKELVESLAADWPELLHTAIPAAAVVERMGIERAPVGVTAPTAPATRAYRALWAEVAARLWS